MKKIIFPVIVLLFLANSKILAKAVYVTNASEIKTALTTVQPGDSIVMADGIWIDSHIIFAANGTLDAPIYLIAETPGKVVLTGTSTLRIAGDYLTVDGLFFKNGYSSSGAVVEFRNSGTESNYSRLTNCAIVDYNPSDKNTDYKWISLYGTHNRVDHCYIKGKKHSGTTLVVWLTNHPNYHLIDHNYFGYRPELGFNGGETIRVGTSDWSMYDSYTTVEYNYFEECDGEIEIISNKSCENTYRYNSFVRCAGSLTLRHGNRCYVYGNYFDGSFKSNSGGVRIIGEDHKVFNNYFTHLSGSGYHSALSVVNGVVNSPLNRYFQVKNAIIAFNTFVDNKYTVTIGAGKSSEQSLPPKNCVIANNIIKTSYSPIVTYTDTPDSLTWEGNIIFGANLGITNPGGIKIEDPKLFFAEDSLWRIESSSPAKDSAVESFNFVTEDFDGQKRDNLPDIGADEFSLQPIIRHPIGPDSVGIDWMKLVSFNPYLKKVQAGPDSLINAINSANPGDILELTTDGGNYSNSSDINISIPLTIRAAQGLTNKPVITNNNSSNSARSVFVIQNGGSLNLNGVELDGLGNTSTPAKYLIRTSDQPMISHYKLIVDNCLLKDVNIGADGNFFRAYPETFADTIKFVKSLLTNSGKEGIRIKDESSNSGNYDVKYFEAENCTFWSIPKEAIYIYGGDSDPNTPGPNVKINHCTFNNCGNSNASIVYCKDVDNAQVINCIFSNSKNNSFSVGLDGSSASISYSDTINVGLFQLDRGAVSGTRILGVAPGYLDTANANFKLSSSSPLLGQASDWKAIGDLRWDPTITSVEKKNNIITDFSLKQNYPNPFNPSTTIEYSIPKESYIVLQIFDIKGSLIETLDEGMKSQGKYKKSWNPKNLASGIYFYTLRTNSQIITTKMLYLK